MISVKNLTKVYKTKRGDIYALNNVSFTLPETGMVFIVGKSGSGKSTLLNMISGLDKFTSGEIIAGGNSLEKMSMGAREKYLSSYIGYVFQDYRLIEDFTVRQNVALAADISDSDRSPDELLSLVGLEGYENRLPKELSGGQKQRVAIARALVKKPKVILADEPTGNLDQNTTKEILKLLKSISKDTLVLIVSHNLRDADEYADRVIELSDGKVVKDKSRVRNYDNRFSYKNGIITLPHHKDLSKVEVGELLRLGKNAKGIVQGEGGFVKTKEPEYKKEDVKLHNKSMSFGNIFKIFSIFFKRKLFSKSVTVFMAAVILSVFYVMQASSMYNTDTAVMDTLVNSDTYGVIIQASSGNASADRYIARMSNEGIASLESAYGGNIYRMYSDYLYTNPNGGGESLITSVQNTIGYYSRITVGTLNTTEEYACKVLGVPELKVLAGTLDKSDAAYKPYGMTITDYTADSIIANYTAANPLYVIDKSTGKMKTTEQLYSEIIGERSVVKEKVYVNAIIDTNYEEECREARDLLSQLTTESNLEDLKSNPVYIDFTTAVNERFNVTYSFDENYYDALYEYLDNNGAYMRASAFFINGAKYSSSVGCAFIIDSENEYNLADGEIVMSTTLYNSAIALSDEKVTSADLADKNKALAESPEDIAMAQYESGELKRLFNHIDLKVTALTSSTSAAVYVNEKTFSDLICFNTQVTAVYLDDPAMARDVLDVVNENKFTICSGMVGNVHFIERCISIFDKFFDVTMAIILVACVAFLVNFGVKTIRSNIYEIGVIKAMGGIKKDISKIFISQSLIMGVGILFETFVGMNIASYYANKIFLASLALVTNSEFYGITAIGFYPLVALADIGIALAVVIISAIISNKSIDKLNLISILKAKE